MKIRYNPMSKRYVIRLEKDEEIEVHTGRNIDFLSPSIFIIKHRCFKKEVVKNETKKGN